MGLMPRPSRETLSYVVGLYGTCTLLRLAAAAIPPQYGQEIGFAWLWYAPLPYLLAWMVLAVPSLGLALSGVLVLALVDGVLFFVGFLLGFALGPVAILACAFALGHMVAWVHALAAPQGDRAAWRDIHIGGASAAGLGLLFQVLMLRGPAAQGVLHLRDYALMGGFLIFGFAWHTAASFERLHAEGRRTATPARAAGLVAMAYAAPAFAFWWANPDRLPLAWPFEFRAAAAEHAARRQADANAEAALWGGREGRTLRLNEAATMHLGDTAIEVVAPLGWLARTYQSPHRGGPIHDWFILHQDEGGALRESAILKVRVDGVSWQATVARPLHEPVPLPWQSSVGPQPVLCNLDVPAIAGLTACQPPHALRMRDDETAALDRLLNKAPTAGWLVLERFASLSPLSVFGQGF